MKNHWNAILKASDGATTEQRFYGARDDNDLHASAFNWLKSQMDMYIGKDINDFPALCFMAIASKPCSSAVQLADDWEMRLEYIEDENTAEAGQPLIQAA